MAKWVKTNLDGFQDSYDKYLGRDKILAINFGDFELDIEGDPFNHSSAERIATLLVNRANIDDLGPCAWEIAYDHDAEYPETTIGGCGMTISAPSQGNIYAILASAFAHYAIGKRHELFLGKVDYYHLKELYEEYWHLDNKQVLKPLQKTLEQFRLHYSDYDNNFLCEMIKEA